MNWIDYMAAAFALCGFGAGLAGAGLLGLSARLVAVAVSAAAAYTLADTVAGPETSFEGRLVAGAVLFALCFLGLTMAAKIADLIPGTASVVRIADGIVSAAVAAAAALLITEAASVRFAEIESAKSRSALYAKIHTAAEEGGIPWKR